MELQLDWVRRHVARWVLLKELEEVSQGSAGGISRETHLQHRLGDLSSIPRTHVKVKREN